MAVITKQQFERLQAAHEKAGKMLEAIETSFSRNQMQNESYQIFKQNWLTGSAEREEKKFRATVKARKRLLQSYLKTMSDATAPFNLLNQKLF